jgi:hypothetical protein
MTFIWPCLPEGLAATMSQAITQANTQAKFYWKPS